MGHRYPCSLLHYTSVIYWWNKDHRGMVRELCLSTSKMGIISVNITGKVMKKFKLYERQFLLNPKGLRAR